MMKPATLSRIAADDTTFVDTFSDTSPPYALFSLDGLWHRLPVNLSAPAGPRAAATSPRTGVGSDDSRPATASIPRMFHQAPAGLDEALLQAGQRPSVDALREHQPPPQVLLAVAGGESSDPTPVRGDAPADLGTAAPDELTGGEFSEDGWRRKSARPGGVSVQCRGNRVIPVEFILRWVAAEGFHDARPSMRKTRRSRRVRV